MHSRRRASSSTETIQLSSVVKRRFWKKGMVKLRLFLHQNRLELLAPPFLSREKVAKEFALVFLPVGRQVCYSFYQEKSKRAPFSGVFRASNKINNLECYG
jgi:hypothetical protein